MLGHRVHNSLVAELCRLKLGRLPVVVAQIEVRLQKRAVKSAGFRPLLQDDRSGSHASLPGRVWLIAGVDQRPLPMSGWLIAGVDRRPRLKCLQILSIKC